MKLIKLFAPLLCIIIIFLFVFSPITYAANNWVNKGNLNTSRFWHTATLLRSGKVLIVGGQLNGSRIKQTEIYDPSTGGWSSSASLSDVRAENTINLINTDRNSGETKVLISGGIDSISYTDKVELYDSDSNTWSMAQNMHFRRSNHRSSMLEDGKVLITGGDNPTVLSSTEVYDPIVNTWTVKSSLNTARRLHAQVTFKDIYRNSKVMVIGGVGVDDFKKLKSTEIYDPNSDTWTPGPDMNFTRYDFSAIALHDGRILVIGGDPNLNTSEVYDPASNSWTVQSTHYTFRYTGSIALLDSNAGYKVLAAAGDSIPTSDAQLFIPETNSWIAVQSMNTPRARFSLTPLQDGSVLASGGFSGIGQLSNTSEVYTPDQIVTPTPTQTPTPTPSVSLTHAPFLDLPFDYQSKGKSFEQVALNPESWFDHKYPLQNVGCCVNTILNYTGEEIAAPYRSHAGYDYALKDGVGYLTPVLAAASGYATVTLDYSGSLTGNMIKIDHGNGYQTWYMHLDPKDLIVKSPGEKIYVNKGDQIGLTGYTGNIFPHNQYGAHIHLGVFKDQNNNGRFDDDYPQGLNDPLGWEGNSPDPWTTYGTGGAQSYSLFFARAKPVQQPIPTSGGTLDTGKVQVSVPAGASPVFFTISSNYGSFESGQDGRQSIVPSLFLTALDNLNNSITHFLQPLQISYNYSEAELTNINEDTIKLAFYNEDTKIWESLPTTLDKTTKIATAQTNHFSHFALMADVKDKIPPVTEVTLQGDKGMDKWYRSSVETQLNSIDNEGGLGVDSTLYSTNGADWIEYKGPFVIDNEGNYKITYQSRDNANNLEEQKSLEFTIDKTPPSTSANVRGTKGNNGWYVSSVSVALSTYDNFGVEKVEYSLDGGVTFKVYKDPVLFSDDGSRELLYRSIDKAGNAEEVKKLTVKIDKMLPNTLVYVTGNIGSDKWYRSNVEVSFNAQESGSGYDKTYYSFDKISYLEYKNPFIVTKEGITKIYYYSTDQAGNKEDQREIEVKIDKTPPEAEIAYDIAKFDVVVTGMDNFGNAAVVFDNSSRLTRKYTINDQAGNKLIISTNELQVGKQVTQTIKSLQYNADPVIQLDRNIFFTVIITGKDNTVKQVNQYFSLSGDQKTFSSYSSVTNNTRISTKGFGNNYNQEIKQGIVLLRLETQKSKVTYSY